MIFTQDKEITNDNEAKHSEGKTGWWSENKLFLVVFLVCNFCERFSLKSNI